LNYLPARSFYERYSQRRGGKKAVVAVTHEMICIVYFMLKMNKPHRDENKRMTERRLKVKEKKA